MTSQPGSAGTSGGADPEGTEPARSEPARGEPARGEPARGEPARGEPRREEPKRSGPGSDLAGEFQRWLIRSSARSMRRELGDQVRRSLGGDRGGRGRREPGDVWSVATAEPPPGAAEAPECAWCPVCKAARRIRESGPGLGGQLSGAGDAVAAAVQEALSAFDSVLSMRPPGSGERPAGRAAEPAGGQAERSAGRAAEQAGEQPDGPDDRG